MKHCLTFIPALFLVTACSTAPDPSQYMGQSCESLALLKDAYAPLPDTAGKSRRAQENYRENEDSFRWVSDKETQTRQSISQAYRRKGCAD